MVVYATRDYLKLLKISYDYLIECHKMYEDSGLKTMKYAQHYHIFSFAMILYSLKERLHYDFLSNDSMITNFFEVGKKFPQKNTPVGKVYELANEWKHEQGFKIRQNFNASNEPEIKVKMHLPVTHYLNDSDVALTDLFKHALEDVELFCKTNNFI